MDALLTLVLLTQNQETDRKLEELQKQVLELQRQIDGLKKAVPRTPPPGEKAPEPSPAAMKVEFKDGLKFESNDGNYKAHVGGALMEHARFSLDGEHDPTAGDRRPDGFFVRMARLEMSGLFWKQFEFKVQYDAPTAAAADSGTLQDGYIGWNPLPEFNLRIGQMKEPFSQEQLTSFRWHEFVERSLVNRLVPGRDIGVLFHGRLFDGQLGYEAGWYNGSGRGVFDADDEKDFAARILGYPLRWVDSLWTKNLRLGVAATIGDVDRDSAYPDYVSGETTLRWLDVDATTVFDGDRDRFGAELTWLVGPVGLRGEWMTRSTDVREIFPAGAGGAIPPSVAGDIHDEGWYLALSWLVTGEDKPMENRVVPAEPFDIEAGTWGAFELALRLAEVTVENDIFSDGFAIGAVPAGTNNSNKIDALTAGFNWYLTRNFRTSFDYVHNWMADAVLIGPTRRDDEEDVFLMRFQIDF